jgi:2-amino-4-hydroxy-6-hydroxymethyldihydropteridine diphosphokinase
MRNLVYLSLGANVGDPAGSMREAITRLGSAGRVIAVSSTYETEPVEFTGQPWFLNCAVSLETAKTPALLMAALLTIEQEMGRQRTLKKGPRTIDIDVLLFIANGISDGILDEVSNGISDGSDTIVDSPELTIPHPAMHERRFVLEPLAEIAPEALHPLLHKTVRQLLAGLPAGQEVRKIQRRATD